MKKRKFIDVVFEGVLTWKEIEVEGLQEGRMRIFQIL